MATEVLHEGDIINPRITNHYSTTINKQLEEFLYIEADTTLKDGRSVNITLKALIKMVKLLHKKQKITTVQKITKNIPRDLIQKKLKTR